MNTCRVLGDLTSVISFVNSYRLDVVKYVEGKTDFSR